MANENAGANAQGPKVDRNTRVVARLAREILIASAAREAGLMSFDDALAAAKEAVSKTKAFAGVAE